MQDTTFPESDTRDSDRQGDCTYAACDLRIRVPYWTARRLRDAQRHDARSFATPGSYFVLDRTWRDGDRVEVHLPMRLHSAPMPDDPTVQAVMYGPLVLAGKLGTAGTHRGNSARRTDQAAHGAGVQGRTGRRPDHSCCLGRSFDLAQARGGGALEFRTVGQPNELTLVPLNRIFDERYAVYWKVSA